MTVLDACQKAAIRLVGRKPTTVFSSTETFELELADLATDVAADIAKSADWQALLKVATLTGDGTSAAFDLPSDYARMPINADLLDANNFAWGYDRITDINQFLYIRQSGLQALPGNWILFGNQFQFVPAPANGAETQFIYVDKNFAADTLGNPKPEFTADSDVFRLEERLLTLGIIWRWRQNKRLDHGEDIANFSKAFAEASGRDKGSRIIPTGPMRVPGNVTIAYPWALGP